MADFYSSSHRAFQDQFDSRRLADALVHAGIRPELGGKERRFIEASDMFFLSTVDHDGWPSVSYKGGFPGFVKVIDPKSLAFPCYDGNGMFYSMGNIVDHAKIGMLFIDFERPRRLRVHGTAQVSSDDPLLSTYKEAVLIVRVSIENAFLNCARYIHKYKPLEASKYVPSAAAETPFPDWKRLDFAQSLLPRKDQGVAEKAGGLITDEQYRREFWKDLE